MKNSIAWFQNQNMIKRETINGTSIVYLTESFDNESSINQVILNIEKFKKWWGWRGGGRKYDLIQPTEPVIEFQEERQIRFKISYQLITVTNCSWLSIVSKDSKNNWCIKPQAMEDFVFGGNWISFRYIDSWYIESINHGKLAFELKKKDV